MWDPTHPPAWMDDGYINFEGFCDLCGAGMRYWNSDCDCTERVAEAREREYVEDEILGLTLDDLEWMAGVYDRAG